MSETMGMRDRRATRSRPAARRHHRQERTQLDVKDPAGQLVCITVYRRGALEVVRRLAG